MAPRANLSPLALGLGPVNVLAANRLGPRRRRAAMMWAGERRGQYAAPIACLRVAGSSSTASMRWATSAREIE
jgi:hypothetical protein